jgi:hypothetical protein
MMKSPKEYCGTRKTRRRRVMKTVKHDVVKLKKALSIKEMADSFPVIGGGVVLLVLSHPFWGVLCILAGMLGVVSELTARKVPKQSRAMSGGKLLLEMIALIAGGILLLSLGQTAGGAVCLAVSVQRAAMSLFVMPMIEKRYLTIAN